VHDVDDRAQHRALERSVDQVRERYGDGSVLPARLVRSDDDRARAASIAEHHDAAVFESLDELLDAVDVVWVCTWTAAHLPIVTAAAERKLAVFCEKPLAPTLAECEQVAGHLESVPHQVGLVLRHAPVFRHAAEAVASGRYGRPLVAILRDDQYFPIQGQYGSEWRADVSKAGGGTLIEHSIHDIDVLQWILGDPATVRADVASRFGHAGIDDVAVLTLGYEHGAMATLVSVWHQVLSRPSLRRLEVFCEHALLWTDDDYLGPLHIETAEGATEIAGALPPWASLLDVPEEFLAPVSQYAEPTKAFLDVLSARDEAATGWPDAATALHAHEVVDAAYRSSAAGGAVTRVEGSHSLRDNEPPGRTVPAPPAP
jgi:predicted dehydrogenase